MAHERNDEALFRSLSDERLSKYLSATNGDRSAALTLYERNLHLAEAFHTPLHCFEIAFRNRLHERMRSIYGEDWLHNGVAPLEDDSLTAIRKAASTVSHFPHAQGAVVAELNLGFWVGLLGPRYDASLWRRTLHAGFRDGVRGMKRSVLHGRVNAIRRFRNRVAHHEPVFDRDLPATHAEIIEAIVWICPDTARWSTGHSRFPAVWEHG